MPVKTCLAVFIVLFTVKLYAQNTYDDALKKLRLKEYAISSGKDTIHFLTTEPAGRKTTVVFCQGSGPVPLVIRLPEGLLSPFPFSLDSNTKKEFNLVVIAKPGLKLYATDKDLDRQQMQQGSFLQLDSLNRPPQKYLDNNNLYELGNDCIAVIRYLEQQPWVDADNIFVFGHSQGANVAAYVAYKATDKIRGLIYSQSNAYGAYAGYLSSLVYSDPYSHSMIALMDSVYMLQAQLLSGDTTRDDYRTAREWDNLPQNVYNVQNGDFYDAATSRWRSLEEPPAIDYLLAIDKSILLLTGLASTGELDNKNVPLDFRRQNKHNLIARFYPGYDHNFFKQVSDEKGNRKEPEFHWDEIWNDVRKWIKTTAK